MDAKSIRCRNQQPFEESVFGYYPTVESNGDLSLQH